MDPNIAIDVLKNKELSAIKMAEGIYDSKKHPYSNLDILVENLCNDCNIPYGRSPAKYNTIISKIIEEANK
jgi:hypothetical protein